MKNDLDVLLFGLVVGGLIGGAGSLFLGTSPHHKKLLINKMKNIVKSAASSLHGVDADMAEEVIEEIQHHIRKGGKTDHLLRAAMIGLETWKKINDKKKGKSYDKKTSR